MTEESQEAKTLPITPKPLPLPITPKPESKGTRFVGQPVGEGFVRLEDGRVIKGNTPTVRLGDIIGEGASGIVYVGTDLNIFMLKRNLALIGDEDPGIFDVTIEDDQVLKDGSGHVVGYELSLDQKVQVIENADRIWIDILRGGRTGMHRLPGKGNVAVKMLQDPEKIRRFEKEYRIASSLDHENIIKFLGLYKGEENFIVMELINGKPLDEYLKSALEILTTKAKLEMTRQASNALDYAHERGIIHRDIKPGNLMITEDVSKQGLERFHVDVADFGVAKAQEGSSTGTSRRLDFTATSEGQRIGTPRYLSPEAARGEVEKITTATDIYSLGVTLYEILTKKLPWTAPDIYTLFPLIGEGREPVPVEVHDPNISSGIADLVWLMMAPEEKDRPSGKQVGDIASALIAHEEKPARLLKEIKQELNITESLEDKAKLYFELAETMPRPRSASKTMRNIADDISLLDSRQRVLGTLNLDEFQTREEHKNDLKGATDVHAERTKTKQFYFMESSRCYEEAGNDYLADMMMKKAAGERRRMAKLSEMQGRPKLFTLPRVIGGVAASVLALVLLGSHMHYSAKAEVDRIYSSAVVLQTEAEGLMRNGKYLEARESLGNAITMYRSNIPGHDPEFDVKMSDQEALIDTSILDLSKQDDAWIALKEAEAMITDYNFTDANTRLVNVAGILKDLESSPCRHVRFSEIRKKHATLDESIVGMKADIAELEGLINKLGNVNKAIKKKAGEISAQQPVFFSRQYIDGVIKSMIQRYEEDLRDDINRQNVKPSDYIDVAFLGYLQADADVAQLVRNSVELRAGLAESRIKSLEDSVAGLRMNSQASDYASRLSEIKVLEEYVKGHVDGITELKGIDRTISEGVKELLRIISMMHEFGGRIKDEDGNVRPISEVEAEVRKKAGVLTDVVNRHLSAFKKSVDSVEGYDKRVDVLTGKIDLFRAIVEGKKAYASGDLEAAKKAFSRFAKVDPLATYLDVIDLEKDAAANATYRVTPGGYDTVMLAQLKRAVVRYQENFDRTPLVSEFKKAAKMSGYEIDLGLFKDLDNKIPVIDSQRGTLDDDDPRAAALDKKLEEAKKGVAGYAGNVYKGVEEVVNKVTPIPAPVMLKELVRKCTSIGETKKAAHYESLIPK